MSQIMVILPGVLMVIALAAAFDGSSSSYDSNSGSQYGSGQYGQASGPSYTSGGGPYGKYRMRREVPSQQPAQAQSGDQAGQEQAKFTPVRGPKQFSFNVQDGIQGANQLRKEKWDNGTMTGMYANPLGNKKYQIINYIADDKGFRVTSTKVVDEAELMADKFDPTQAKKAQIDIDNNGAKTSYSVTPDQIAPKNKQQQQRDTSSSNQKKMDQDSQEDDKDEKNDKSKSKTGQKS